MAPRDSQEERLINDYTADSVDIGRPDQPWKVLSKQKLAALIFAIMLSNLSTAVDAGLSASAHVAIASAFNKTNISMWPVNAFLVTSMTCQPLYPRLSDHLGRKIPFLVASVLFNTGLLFSSVATSWTGLIAARAICGMGIGGLMTMGSVLLNDTISLEKRGYFQSANYIVYGSGSAVGSAFGGILSDALGWSWVYKMQLPLSITVLVLLVMSIPSQDQLDTRSPKGKSSPSPKGLHDFDWRGSICLVLVLSSLFFCLMTGGNVFPWAHPLVLLTAFSFLVALAVLYNVEKKAARPILPPGLFLKSPTGNLILTGFLFSLINYTVTYNTAFFFQTVDLESVAEASSRLIVPSISFTIASALAGYAIARLKNPAPTLRISQLFLVIGTIGLVVMSVMIPSIGTEKKWTYSLGLLFPAFGAGMMAPSIVLTLLQKTDELEQAVASGSLIMMRSLGVSVSTALSTTIVQNVFRASMAAGQYDEATRKKIEATRQDIRLIHELDEQVRSKVVKAYSHSFLILFGICFCAALLIAALLARIKLGGFREAQEEEEEEKDDANGLSMDTRSSD